MFIFAIILAVLALISFLVWRFGLKVTTKTVRGRYSGDPSYEVEVGKLAKTITGWVTLGLAALAVLFLLLGSFYNQQEGTAHVQVDVTGKAVGVTTTAGFHLKWPWVNTVEFNVRNQPVAFGGSADTWQDGGGAGYTFDGPQVTINASDGVKVDQDLQVTYSIKPDAVLDIYRDWKTEDAFKNGFVYQDIRNAVREQGNARTTLELITGLAAFGSDIDAALVKKWEKEGVIVNSVNLQEPRPPQSVTDSYAAAQQAEIDIATKTSAAKAKLEEAKGEANAARERANGEADANRTLAASLTPEVLQKLLIDAYKEGTVYVTDGSTDFLLGAR